MTKLIINFITLSLVSIVSFSHQAMATEALRCYAFFGVKYKTSNLDSQQIEIEDSTKVILEQTTPVVNQKARLVMENDQIRYDADYDGKYFRLELTDKTNGQSSHFFGPSSSFADGVDTCLFFDLAKDSALKASWDDLENKIGDVFPDSLQVTYATVQCQVPLTFLRNEASE